MKNQRLTSYHLVFIVSSNVFKIYIYILQKGSKCVKSMGRDRKLGRESMHSSLEQLWGTCGLQRGRYLMVVVSYIRTAWEKGDRNRGDTKQVSKKYSMYFLSKIGPPNVSFIIIRLHATNKELNRIWGWIQPLSLSEIEANKILHKTDKFCYLQK